MKKTIIRFLGAPVIFLVLLMLGWWDHKEINEISIVTGMGIDAAQTEGEIRVTLQSGKTTNGSSDQSGTSKENKALVMEASGKSVTSVLEMFRTKNSRVPFLHHNQVIIFGEELARKGIREYLDVFMREYEMRMEIWVMVCEGEARDILSAPVEPENISGLVLTRMMQNEVGLARSRSASLLQYISCELDKTTSPVMPIIRMEEEDEKKKLVLSGMAVFKEGKMIGRLSQEEIEGYVWLMGDAQERTIEINTDLGRADLRLLSIQCKTNPSFETGRASVSLTITSEIVVRELQGFYDIKLSDLTLFLQQEVQKKIEQEVRDCFEKSQELKADIFAIGAAFYKKYPKEWKSMQTSWEEIYPKLEVQTDIKIGFIDTGKIVNAIDMKEEG